MARFVIALILVLAGSPSIAEDSSIDATEIVQKADDKMKGKSSRGRMTITIVRPTYTRDMEIVHWSKGSDLYMILITSPKRDRGTAFLKRDKEIWNWLPTVERTVKLPPSMMSQNWMGTDFSNDDLVKQSSMVVDYTHAIVSEEEVDGLVCWKIRLTPKPDAAVVWGKIFMWIDKQDYMQMKAEFYDEDELLINTMVGMDPKVFDGQRLPSVMEMVPADKEGQKTIMVTGGLEFDVPLDDNFFTVRSMKSVRQTD